VSSLLPTRARSEAISGYTHELLSEAHRARNKGRERRAIGLYKRVLLEDPHNADVALRVAPMLARRGQGFEAWQLYRRAARDFARAKRWGECLTVYREACRFVPYEFEAWSLCAELQIKMGREDAAFETLVDGRMHFRDPACRAQAIALLTRARSIEPWDTHVVLDLARLYARTDLTDLALELLLCLGQRTRGADLRKVRALQWRITLSLRFGWLWLRALSQGADEPAALERYEEAPLP
jgi:thioredoxin-like negative regulator of GroEL